MRRTLTALLIATILSISTGASMTARANTIRDKRWAECRFQLVDGRRGFSVTEVKRTIHCAAKKFNVDVSTALYIAERESGFYQYAVNSTSGALGIFQIIPSNWPRWRDSLIAARPKFKGFRRSGLNARTNTLTALRMAHLYGWGAWSM